MSLPLTPLFKLIGFLLTIDGAASMWLFRKHKKAGRISFQLGRALRFIGGCIIMVYA